MQRNFESHAKTGGGVALTERVFFNNHGTRNRKTDITEDCFVNCQS